jgi:hypothetical protein
VCGLNAKRADYIPFSAESKEKGGTGKTQYRLEKQS